MFSKMQQGVPRRSPCPQRLSAVAAMADEDSSDQARAAADFRPGDGRRGKLSVASHQLQALSQLQEPDTEE